LDPAVLSLVAEVTSGQERPRMKAMLEALRERCNALGLTAPSRATVYKLLDSLPCPTRRVRELPASAQKALYNLVAESEAPLHQIAFYCFNYGELDAVSYASGLPWLALHQARRMRGHCPGSVGLLEAVLCARRI
jgi:Fe2+ or Zn2+ uptake regulation protein